MNGNGMHRWSLLGNHPFLTVVMLIYHYLEVMWRIVITTNFLYNIYNHEKYYPGETANIHLQYLINISQEKNCVIKTKKG